MRGIRGGGNDEGETGNGKEKVEYDENLNITGYQSSAEAEEDPLNTSSSNNVDDSGYSLTYTYKRNSMGEPQLINQEMRPIPKPYRKRKIHHHAECLYGSERDPRLYDQNQPRSPEDQDPPELGWVSHNCPFCRCLGTDQQVWHPGRHFVAPETEDAEEEEDAQRQIVKQQEEDDRIWFPEVTITHELINNLDLEVEVVCEVVNDLDQVWPEEESPTQQEWYELNRDVSMNLSK